MQATAKHRRRATGEVLRAVGRGEHVVVTYRGKPVATMAPLATASDVEESELFGIWKDNPAAASSKDYVDQMRKGNHGTH